ncbi:MAG: IS1634 family transposase [Desulfobacterales bacterium]
MYVERVPNRNSPPALLLRESYREFGKVKKRTLANLSKLPEATIEQIRMLLRGGQVIENAHEHFQIVRSLPHGHVVAVLGSVLKLGLDQIIDTDKSRQLAPVLAMIVSRIIAPASKLATARGIDSATAHTSLGEQLELKDTSEDELYEAMDWLFERQQDIEDALAKRHLQDGTLVLYDVTSTYFEGRCCPLARLGHSRDGKKDKLQIVIGLLCAADGCPVAIEVFEGNTADPKTVKSQLDKLRQRFGIQRIVLVGDRGMITAARIRQDLLAAEGVDWITALRAPQIAQLVESGEIQLSLFDTRDMAEISHPDYPGERLIVCRNPYLAYQRTVKRQELLKATEKHLDKIVAATLRERRPLKGADKIGIRVGKVLGKFKMAKHFLIQIEPDEFSYQRNEEGIASEAALDGIYVIRTSVGKKIMNSEQAVQAYKSLSNVERAFRSIKSVDLKVRPIYHRLAHRVKTHVFLCMLAYYVEWHMRRVLAPMLFDDHDKDAARMQRESVVAPAKRSAAAEAKACSKVCEDKTPVHSFHTLLSDLATIVKNTVKMKNGTTSESFEKITQPTALQQRALELLGVKLAVCGQ